MTTLYENECKKEWTDTLAASSGMDVKTLQTIAGHSDIKMTLDRYADERENNIISAGSLIGNIFRSM